ncbi:MAG: AraC family transcriptional regulator [Ignavibacteriales bacterium]|nr:AraC family transcriptional regulator [Ignavibacteriales bacterium]
MGSFITNIFLLASVHGFLLAALLFFKKKNRNANRVLSFAIFILALDLLFVYSTITEFYKTFPSTFGINFAFPFIYGPIFYLYTKIVTGNETHFRAKHLLHFIPFVLAHLYVSPFYLLSAQGKLAQIEIYLNEIQYDLVFIGFLKAVHGIIYTSFSLGLIHRFDKNLRESLSNIDKIKLNWLRFLITGTLIVWIVVALTILIPVFVDPSLNIYDSIIYFFISIFIYAVGYGALNQPEVFNYHDEKIKLADAKEETESTGTAKYIKSSLTEVDIERIKTELIDIVEGKKLYLKSDLTLSQLAEELKASNHNLSEVINTSFNKNFYDFINFYRVEEFKQRIKKPEYDNYSLLAVAFDSGFSSKTSFNSIFKKYTNTTPSEYKRQMKLQFVLDAENRHG